IYHVTIIHSLIHSYWFEKGKRIQINKKNVFFQKIIEMEYKEIFEKPLDLSFQHKLEKQQKQIEQLVSWVKSLQEENAKLKTETELLKHSNSKTRNHG
ncbi:hypothetical protein, partial [Spiroplasma endosymbiont of Lariophagus distinguendus]|uniref:hypothetical protein n=1 Tax=Spiroplasma endosymbiont of Lariophagus distinguendus TaxID=2935082 RepID=UPI00207AA332